MIRVEVKALSPISRAGLMQMLASHREFHLVDEEESGSGRQDETVADVVILETDADADIEELSDFATGSAAVIVLVQDPSQTPVAEMVRAGVRAVLSQRITEDELIAAVHAVAAGLLVLQPESVAAAVPGRPAGLSGNSLVEPLTHREHEVLTMMGEGLANKEIASRLGISEHTVKFHVASVMAKLGAASRTEAVTLAIRRGILFV